MNSVDWEAPVGWEARLVQLVQSPLVFHQQLYVYFGLGLDWVQTLKWNFYLV